MPERETALLMTDISLVIATDKLLYLYYFPSENKFNN